MNSNNDSRKSMDDVLASIRRIVRAEKEPDSAEPAPRANRPARPAGDEPLALTPDMRMDAGTVEPEAISRPAEGSRAAAAEQATGGGTAAAGGGTSGAAATSNREALRRLVREILIEELTTGDAEGAVRGIIRDELMNGEIGGNISQNVLRLIQAEVARANEKG